MSPSTLELDTHAPREVDSADLTVADAVWIGMAILQMESKSALPFMSEIIVTTVQSLGLTQADPKSIRQHVNQHCVANRKPQPNRACMLYDTGKGNRRLFRDSDPRDPGRKGAPSHPAWSKLPAKYAFLREWYETVWNTTPTEPVVDPLLALAGTGRGMWGGHSADDYVSSLRKGWESAS
jgi:hypothetical protein